MRREVCRSSTPLRASVKDFSVFVGDVIGEPPFSMSNMPSMSDNAAFSLTGGRGGCVGTTVGADGEDGDCSSSGGRVSIVVSMRFFAHSFLEKLRWSRGGTTLSPIESKYVQAIVPERPFPAVKRVSLSQNSKFLGPTFTV